MPNTDPKHYSLNPRTKLEAIGDNEIAIVKCIKSRIIRKDALKIVEMAEQIKSIAPTLNVSLKCYDNICSKSLSLLEGNKIGVKIV